MLEQLHLNPYFEEGSIPVPRAKFKRQIVYFPLYYSTEKPDQRCSCDRQQAKIGALRPSASRIGQFLSKAEIPNAQRKKGPLTVSLSFSAEMWRDLRNSVGVGTLWVNNVSMFNSQVMNAVTMTFLRHPFLMFPYSNSYIWHHADFFLDFHLRILIFEFCFDLSLVRLRSVVQPSLSHVESSYSKILHCMHGRNSHRSEKRHFTSNLSL